MYACLPQCTVRKRKLKNDHDCFDVFNKDELYKRKVKKHLELS